MIKLHKIKGKLSKKNSLLQSFRTRPQTIKSYILLTFVFIEIKYLFVLYYCIAGFSLALKLANKLALMCKCVFFRFKQLNQ